MKIKHGSVTLAASVASALVLPADVTRARRWQLFVRSNSLSAAAINDSSQKTLTNGMYIPIYATGSGDFQAGTYRYGDKLWLFSTAITVVEYYFKEIV